MKKQYSLLLFIGAILLLNITGYSQIQILTPNDTTICNGATAKLRAVVHGRSRNVISIAVDDDYSGVIPIGFPFAFYGQYYTTCLVSSNGYIRFDTTNKNSFSQWSLITTPGRDLIPGNPNCVNSFCGVYSDIYPVTGGTIDYSTIGTAPNRQFIVTFCRVPLFSCNSQLITFQMILNEGSNTCECHITYKDVCAAWNGGFAIEGVQNLAGTAATVAPGRNDSVQWTAMNDAYRFSPILPAFVSYSVAAIPFAPIPDSTSQLYWFQGGTYLGMGDTVIVAPNVTTVYTVKAATSCGDTSQANITVVVGGGPAISGYTLKSPSYCGGCDGKIVLHGLTPNDAVTVTYRKNGVHQLPLSVAAAADSTITLINLCAGTYDSIVAKSGVCHSDPAGPIKLLDPPVLAAFNYNILYGCMGDTVVFNNRTTTTGTSALHYIWQFGDATADTARNPEHLYHNQGTYTVLLKASTNGCSDTASKTIKLIHPIKASFTVSKDTICQNQTIKFTNTSVGTNPGYFWTFGDGDTSSSASPTQLFTHSGIFTVKLLENDFVPCYDSAYLNVNVDSVSFVKITTSDSTLCQGKAITFIGHYLDYGYLSNMWNFGDGTVISNANPIEHGYETPGTYKVTLTANYRVCPDTTAATFITVSAYPAVNVGTDTAMCPGSQGILLTALAGGPGATWLWNTGDTTSSITATQPGLYYATVTVNKCSSTDSVLIRNDCYIDIPNVFSPNNDGVNDYFFPRQLLTSSVTTFNMMIYNRWGQEIFATTNVNGRGWDGKLNSVDQPEGVYIYVIDVSFTDGNVEHHKGNITLLR